MYLLTTLLLLLAVLVALVYIFLTWNFNYWKKQGIKTARAWPLLGSFPSMFTQKRNPAYDINDIYCKYKGTENIVGVMNTRMPQLLALTPEYAHKIYVTEFRSFHDNEMFKFVNEKTDKLLANNPFMLTGEQWKERRAEITPGLTANRIHSVYPVTQNICQQLVDYIRRQQKMAPACGLNAKELSLCYTTEVVTDCVLGVSAQSFSDTPTPVVGMIKRVFEQSFSFIMYTALVTLWPPIRKIYAMPFFAKDVEQFFYEFMQKSIDLRRQSGPRERVDFLNYMLQLQEKKRLSTVELASHTITFLTDGFETSALVLAHTLLMIARNPTAQRQLREEVGEATLDFEQLSNLPYLDACIHETLRIFPPLLTGAKVVTEPFEFANKDGRSVCVNIGDAVMVPVYSLHHDAEYYEQPEEFRPERFLEENGGLRKYRDQGLYFGFGDGPRVCPGMRFALTQIKAALVTIVRHFNVKPNPRTRKDNILDDKYFMATLKGGIWLDFEARQ